MYQLPPLTKQLSYSAIAVMTSGGDSPGMNPAIRAVVRSALNNNIKVFGINRGYSGLIIGDIFEMDSKSVSNIIQSGGTLLKSDRCEAFHDPAVRKQAATILQEKGIEALIVIGGDGSLTGAHLMAVENSYPVIGLPGTIDNDVHGTDDTIGFDTAVNTAIEAIDKIRDTALSHERLFLVEVMGRNSGFIATNVGLACGAEMIIVPEYQIAVESISFTLATNREEGKGSSGIIVVAEGPEPGLTDQLAGQLKKLGQEPRVCILGHIQRGGVPNAHDRILASCMGATAVQYLLAGSRDIMIGVKDNKLIEVPLKDVVEHNKKMGTELLDIAHLLHR